MKSKRIKTLLASILTASLIVSNSATVFATPTPPLRNISAKSVNNMLINLTAEQREALEQLEATPHFRISPDINLNSPEKIKVIVQFKQDPSKVEIVKNQIKGRTISIQSAEAKVEDSHRQFKEDLNRIMGNEKYLIETVQTNQEQDQSTQNERTILDAIKIHSEYKNAFNGVSLTIPANAIEKLLESDVVKTVWNDYEINLEMPEVNELGNIEEKDSGIRPQMKESVPHIGVDKLHEEGITGKGIKVGVIDTGVDYNHPDLKDAYKGGWDCVDEDDDPMETTYQDWIDSGRTWMPYQDYVTAHGTHVAGTIVGQAKNDSIDTVKGVAPDADLYAYRVLGPGGSGYDSDVLQGIDKAVEDGMDVINLSLGADINDPLDVTSVAINNVVLSGVVAAVAAGNAGPRAHTVGSPGTSALAITVGASNVTRSIPTFDCSVNDSNFEIKLLLRNFQDNLEELVGKSLTIEYAGLGLQEDFEDKDFSGKIILFDRYDQNLGNQLYYAKEAGAAAVIICNNLEDDMPFYGEYVQYSTSFSITKDHGEKLKTQLENNEEIQFKFDEMDSIKTEGDHLAYFSSSGPVRENYDIKPDIVAPGVQIFSTVPEYINDPDGEVNYDVAYSRMSGTSMATPHIAGISALLLQQHPEYNPFDVKTVLMTTSEDLNRNYSVYEEGAGRVNAYEAVHSDILIQVLDTTKTIDENGNVIEIDEITGSIVFGRHYKNGSTITESRIVTIINNDSIDKEFELSVEFNSEDTLGIGTKDAEENGVTIDMPETIIVNSNDNVKFEPSILIPDNAEAGTYEGYVRLVNKNNADEEYQIPFAVVAVEKGIGFFKVNQNAICTDRDYYYNMFSSSYTIGLLKLNSPLKSLDVIVKDGITGEVLGYRGSVNLDNIPIDEKALVYYLFDGQYYPFTGDEKNPISDERVLAPEGHYKVTMIGTDEDGNVYEASDDVIIDNTPPEFTIDEEPDIYELNDDILTTEIDPRTEQEMEALWIHGSIHDSTIDYLKELGYEEDAFGRPIDQGLNTVVAQVFGGWINLFPVIQPDGSFKLGLEENLVSEGWPTDVKFYGVDLGTCGFHFNPYWFELVAEDDVYMAVDSDKDEITNGDEFTVTLTFNNVEDFVSGQSDYYYDPRYFEFVDAKINPELQNFADENGLDLEFSAEETEKWAGSKFVIVRAELEEKEGNSFEGFDGDIQFADITLKYTGGCDYRHYSFKYKQAYYSKFGDEQLISIPGMSRGTIRIKEQYSSTSGRIRSEGHSTIYGFPNLNLPKDNVKIYAEAPAGERYNGYIERGQFYIENLPLIDQDYKIVIESPGHFVTYEYDNLFRYYNGELVPINGKADIGLALAGDVNGDNVIDILDAIEVHDSYGEYKTIIPEDLNLDYKVDDIDMSYVYKNFMAVNEYVDVNVTPKDEYNGTKLEDTLSYLHDKGIFVGNINAEDGFVPGESVKVEARVHNFGEKDKNVTFILALYDQNNKLIEYVETSKAVKVPDGRYINGMEQIKANIKTTEETVKVKCFVWDSLDNLEPLVEVFELPVMNN